MRTCCSSCSTRSRRWSSGSRDTARVDGFTPEGRAYTIPERRKLYIVDGAAPRLEMRGRERRVMVIAWDTPDGRGYRKGCHGLGHGLAIKIPVHQYLVKIFVVGMKRKPQRGGPMRHALGRLRHWVTPI